MLLAVLGVQVFYIDHYMYMYMCILSKSIHTCAYVACIININCLITYMYVSRCRPIILHCKVKLLQNATIFMEVKGVGGVELAVHTQPFSLASCAHWLQAPV